MMFVKNKNVTDCSKKTLEYSVVFICFPLFCQYLMGCNGKIVKNVPSGFPIVEPFYEQ